MLRSLYSGVSGMKVNQTKMDVIGNNIANVGTTGFKAGRVRFEDMLSQTDKPALAPMTNAGGINPSQVGLGVQVAGIDTLVSQGMMQPTGNNLDAAIDGDGYFTIGKGPEIFATTTAAPYPIGINSNSTVSGGGAVTHNLTSSSGTDILYTRDGSFTLDSNGDLLTSDGYHVMGYSVSDTSASTPVQSLDMDTSQTPNVPVVNFVDASKTTLKADDVELKTLKIPEYVMDNSTSPASQVRVKTYTIGRDGQITGVLEDGRVTVLGQIAMASFKNPAGLTKMGKNLYQDSANSGLGTFRTGVGAAATDDNSKGYGDINQGMLEMSNVDLAEQFTEMIVTSRAFQASGKMISTGDEMLQDIIDLKR